MLQLADKYNVKDLLQLGLDFMARNVAIAAKRNQIVSWYQFATNCGYKDTSQLCLDFIKWNFEMVTESIDWPNMEHESLVKLLNCSDLVVHDEMVVFLKVEKWLEEQQRRMEETGEEDIDLHMENLVTSAINCVRFPMMYPAQVRNCTKLYNVYFSSLLSHLLVGRPAAVPHHQDVHVVHDGTHVHGYGEDNAYITILISLHYSLSVVGLPQETTWSRATNSRKASKR